MDYALYKTEDFLTDESFILYCYGDDEAAKAHWENILNDQPELRKNINDARSLCLLLGIKVSTAEKVTALERLKTIIDLTGEIGEPQSYPYILGRKTYFSRWMAIAASLLIIASTYGIYKFNVPPSSAALYSAANTANYRLIGTTDFNHRKHIVLPDGSSVLLNGSSTLKIANDYNASNRHVLLSGEAFFLVKKNPQKPFVVITGKIATTALGTSFKVQSYPDENEASVMLLTGKVKLESTQYNLKVDHVTLLPGQQASLPKGDNAFNQSSFSEEGLHNWLNRKLVFSDAGLKEITVKLKEMYGIVVIPVNKPGEDISFTGQFNDKNLTDVLDAIGFTNHFTYKQEGNSVKLMF